MSPPPSFHKAHGACDRQGLLQRRLHQRTASAASGGEAESIAGAGLMGITSGMVRPLFLASNDGEELLGGLPRVVVLEGSSLLQVAAGADGASMTFAVDAGAHEEDRVTLLAVPS